MPSASSISSRNTQRALAMLKKPTASSSLDSKNNVNDVSFGSGESAEVSFTDRSMRNYQSNLQRVKKLRRCRPKEDAPPCVDDDDGQQEPQASKEGGEEGEGGGCESLSSTSLTSSTMSGSGNHGSGGREENKTRSEKDASFEDCVSSVMLNKLEGDARQYEVYQPLFSQPHHQNQNHQAQEEQDVYQQPQHEQDDDNDSEGAHSTFAEPGEGMATPSSFRKSLVAASNKIAGTTTGSTNRSVGSRSRSRSSSSFTKISQDGGSSSITSSNPLSSPNYSATTPPDCFDDDFDDDYKQLHTATTDTTWSCASTSVSPCSNSEAQYNDTPTTTTATMEQEASPEGDSEEDESCCRRLTYWAEEGAQGTVRHASPFEALEPQPELLEPEPPQLDHHHQESWDDMLETIQEQLATTCEVLLSAAARREATDVDVLDVVREHLQARSSSHGPFAATAAVAFYHGLSVQHHVFTRKMQDLQEHHQRQLDMLVTNDNNNNNNTATLDVAPATSTSFCGSDDVRFLQKSLRFLPLSSYHFHHYNDSTATRLLRGQKGLLLGTSSKAGEDHDNHTVVTTLSTMSCRELSIEKLRRSRLRQMHQQPSEAKDDHNPSKEDDDDHEKNNAHIQQLLEDLKQAEQRQKRLEQQLNQAGIVLAEDIPYEEAKEAVGRISRRMNEIGDSQIVHDDPQVQKALREEYFTLEQQMERYMAALMLTDEFVQEQQAAEDEWEASVAKDNQQALVQVRRHMPVCIAKMTKEELVTKHGLSLAMVNKFKRSNILQLLRRDPELIVRWHPSNLEGLRQSNLTLTERRALHQHLRPVVQLLQEKGGTDPLSQRKMTCLRSMTCHFKEMLAKYQHHVATTDGKTGPDHSCTMIGKACPVRADLVMDYSGDLGFPAGDVYEESSFGSSVARTNYEAADPTTGKDNETARQEELWNQRRQALKEHYKHDSNTVQQVANAWSVCELMEDLVNRMDQQREQWIVQQLQAKDGSKDGSDSQPTATTTKWDILSEVLRELSTWAARAKGGDGIDARSLVEIGLLEDVYDAVHAYLSDIGELAATTPDMGGDGRAQIISKVQGYLETMHALNLSTLDRCFKNQAVPEKRKRKSRTEIAMDYWKNDKSTKEPSREKKATPEPQHVKKRGSLLDSIASRQESKPSAPQHEKQRGSLLDSIASRQESKASAPPLLKDAPSNFLDAIRQAKNKVAKQ